MIEVTFTCSPPICLVMSPQKFSPATTAMGAAAGCGAVDAEVLDGDPDELVEDCEPQPEMVAAVTVARAPRAISTRGWVRIVTGFLQANSSLLKMIVIIYTTQYRRAPVRSERNCTGDTCRRGRCGG